ncbi:hypothetical protein C7974DRAFT_443072, partial [Boeremia exigua]|uniref:uncharacterized protein n=1 Tax=Boeremia exigua TaxID=749465 RepID=UPI001E8D321F
CPPAPRCCAGSTLQPTPSVTHHARPVHARATSPRHLAAAGHLCVPRRRRSPRPHAHAHAPPTRLKRWCICTPAPRVFQKHVACCRNVCVRVLHARVLWLRRRARAAATLWASCARVLVVGVALRAAMRCGGLLALLALPLLAPLRRRRKGGGYSAALLQPDSRGALFRQNEWFTTTSSRPTQVRAPPSPNAPDCNLRSAGRWRAGRPASGVLGARQARSLRRLQYAGCFCADQTAGMPSPL